MTLGFSLDDRMIDSAFSELKYAVEKSSVNCLNIAVVTKEIGQTILSAVFTKAKDKGLRAWLWARLTTFFLRKRVSVAVQTALDSYRLQMIQKNKGIPIENRIQGLFSAEQNSCYTNATISSFKIKYPEVSSVKVDDSQKWETFLVEENEKIEKLQSKSGPVYSAIRTFRERKKIAGETFARIGLIDTLDKLDFSDLKIDYKIFTDEEVSIILAVKLPNNLTS